MPSKSSSKSNSKSILPKGITFIQVALAIVIGLLLCSLMSGSPMVEGLVSSGACKSQSDFSKVKGCPSGTTTTLNSTNNKWVCNTSSTDSTIQQAAIIAGNNLTCDAGGDNTGLKQGLNPLTGRGVCKGKMSTTQDSLCEQTKSEKECNTSEVCSFKKHDDIYSYSGGLEGSIYTEWMTGINAIDENLDPIDPIPKGAIGRNAVTSLIDLNLHRDGKKVSPDDIKNNFLKYLTGKAELKTTGVVKPDDIDNNTLVPVDLQATVKSYVEECASGWIQDSDEYKANGNRPIMTYNATDGLICRNPFYQPVQSAGTIPRILHLGHLRC